MEFGGDNWRYDCPCAGWCAIDRASRPMNGQPGQRSTAKGVAGGVYRMTSRSDGKDSVDGGRKYRSTGIPFHFCFCLVRKMAICRLLTFNESTYCFVCTCVGTNIFIFIYFETQNIRQCDKACKQLREMYIEYF